MKRGCPHRATGPFGWVNCIAFPSSHIQAVEFKGRMAFTKVEQFRKHLSSDSARVAKRARMLARLRALPSSCCSGAPIAPRAYFGSFVATASLMHAVLFVWGLLNTERFEWDSVPPKANRNHKEPQTFLAHTKCRFARDFAMGFFGAGMPRSSPTSGVASWGCSWRLATPAG